MSSLLDIKQTKVCHYIPIKSLRIVGKR